VVADDGIDAMAPQHDVHAAGTVSDEALDGAVDMVLMMRELHMMKNWGTLDTWLRASFRMLKPNGILGIEDHRAAPGANPAMCDDGPPTRGVGDRAGGGRGVQARRPLSPASSL